MSQASACGENEPIPKNAASSKPGFEGQFLLRTFTEKPNESHQLWLSLKDKKDKFCQNKLSSIFFASQVAHLMLWSWWWARRQTRDGQGLGNSCNAKNSLVLSDSLSGSFSGSHSFSSSLSLSLAFSLSLSLALSLALSLSPTPLSLAPSLCLAQVVADNG